jgi:hypothetical protein
MTSVICKIAIAVDILGIITGIFVAIFSSPYGITIALAYTALLLKDIFGGVSALNL